MERLERISSAEIQSLPITHDFHIERVHPSLEGFDWAEQWIGVTLPVREGSIDTIGSERITDEEGYNAMAVTIYVEDAVVALIDQGKQEFADFWGSHEAPTETLTFFDPIGRLTPHENQQII